MKRRGVICAQTNHNLKQCRTHPCLDRPRTDLRPWILRTQPLTNWKSGDDELWHPGPVKGLVESRVKEETLNFHSWMVPTKHRVNSILSWSFRSEYRNRVNHGVPYHVHPVQGLSGDPIQVKMDGHCVHTCLCRVVTHSQGDMATQVKIYLLGLYAHV